MTKRNDATVLVRIGKSYVDTARTYAHNGGTSIRHVLETFLSISMMPNKNFNAAKGSRRRAI